MTTEERKLVMELASDSISREQFLKRFPADLSDSNTYIRQGLEKALVEENSDDVEYVLILGFCLGFSVEHVDVLNRLLLQPWHYKHEDIARLLKRFASPSSVDPLYKTALAEFEYLNYDDGYALAVKCIWALGAIKTDAALEKLEQLAQSDKPILREAAAKQIERIRAV